MHKFQYGRDLSATLAAGSHLTLIISTLGGLQTPIGQSLLLHHIYEGGKFKDKKWVNEEINDNLQHLRATLTPKIKMINEQISSANKLLKGLDFKHSTIPNVKVNEVMGAVRKRLLLVFELKDARKISDENLNMSLLEIAQRPTTAILDFYKVVGTERYREEVKKLSEPYRQGITQALSVCSIGYYSTSVFIAGKTIEEVVNDYFGELFRLNKQEIFNLNDKKLKDKIGRLFGNKLINEDLYYKLSNIRLDRNEFAHPSKKLLSKRQAHLRILYISEIIPELEKKIKRLRAKKS